MSHETIYLTLFIQARGGLKRGLAQHLRTRRTNRRPKGTKPPSGKGKIVDPVMISERPAEVEDRAVPGQWEGDLLMGKRQTAIGTLVFSLDPRCHGDLGSQKETWMPVSMVNWACWAISLP